MLWCNSVVWEQQTCCSWALRVLWPEQGQDLCWDWFTQRNGVGKGGFRVVKPLAGGRGRPGRCNHLVRLDAAACGRGMLEEQLSGLSDHLLPKLSWPLGHIKGFGMKARRWAAVPIGLLAVMSRRWLAERLYLPKEQSLMLRSHHTPCFGTQEWGTKGSVI